MGTNAAEFVREANRILKKGGALKVAEVRSRIKRVDLFVRGVERLGFAHVSKDESNNVFLIFEFEKVKEASPRVAAQVSLCLDPCIYKKR